MMPDGEKNEAMGIGLKKRLFDRASCLCRHCVYWEYWAHVVASCVLYFVGRKLIMCFNNCVYRSDPRLEFTNFTMDA